MEHIRRVAPLCLLVAIGLLGATGCYDENEPQGLGPVSVSVFPDGELPDTTSDLIANAWSNHPVGEPPPTFSFSWKLNGVDLDPPPADPQKIPAAMTTKADVWEVTATASFGSTVVGPDSASLTIINSQPEVELDRITNRNPDCPNDAITVVATPSDYDGDTVTLTYEWTVNNVLEPAATGDSLDCQYFDVDDRVRVSVRPFDGEDFGRTQLSNLVKVGPPPSPASSPIPSSATASAATEVVVAAAEPLVRMGLRSASTRPDALDVTAANACHIGSHGAITCTGEEAHGVAEPPRGGFVQLAVELDYACAVRADDASLVCWGDPVDDLGQVDPPSGAFSRVAVGMTAACALSLDGVIACWGDDADGLTSPPPGVFVELDMAQSSACAMDASGAVACWGRSD